MHGGHNGGLFYRGFHRRRSHQEAAPHAAGEPSPQISALTVPKKYAAGLEMSYPGGALFQTGLSNPQQPRLSNDRAANGNEAEAVTR